MRNTIYIIEYNKGSDKSFDGFRADTKPILKAIKETTAYETDIVFYRPKKSEQLLEFLQKNAFAVISRINPGNLKEVDPYFQFLKQLSTSGVQVHTHPDVMINLDFKDILFKLKNSALGEKTTMFYQDFIDFKTDFPTVIQREKIRVLKTNYGSTGEGVYLVSLKESGKVICTEAVNNEKVKFDSLEAFMDDFESKFEPEDTDAVYFKNKKGFVSCKYLNRISEGEIRVLLVNDKPIAVVHKKPQEGEFSATLFSGAKYYYEAPTEPKWKEVISLTMNGLDDIKELCQGQDFPLLWTMDYILDYDEQGADIYVLSETNCSCVGITTELQYAKEIAQVFHYEMKPLSYENKKEYSHKKS